MATAVAAEGDPSRLFALVSEEVARLLDAETAALMRFDGDLAIAVGALQQARRARACRSARVMPLRADTAAGARLSDGRARAGGELRRARRRRRARAAPASGSSPRWRRRCSSAAGCGARWSSSSVDRQPFPEDAEQRIAYFAELAAQALANAQAREELDASRARIVQAGDEERRRLERNLHDGAQQRLVSLALMLRLAARRHPDDEDLGTRRRGARPRAAGAPRAGPRHPPGGPDRARAGAGAARARRPRAGAGRARVRADVPAPRPGRGRGLLRRLRGAHERRQVRRRLARARPRRRRTAAPR